MSLRIKDCKVLLRTLVQNRIDLLGKRKFSSEKQKPGEGLRSMRSTTAFRVINFELYAKPNIVIMSIGLTCFGLALGYIAYMRQKYESMGYYTAVNQDGKCLRRKNLSGSDNTVM